MRKSWRWRCDQASNEESSLRPLTFPPGKGLSWLWTSGRDTPSIMRTITTHLLLLATLLATLGPALAPGCGQWCMPDSPALCHGESACHAGSPIQAAEVLSSPGCSCHHAMVSRPPSVLPQQTWSHEAASPLSLDLCLLDVPTSLGLATVRTGILEPPIDPPSGLLRLSLLRFWRT